MKIAVLGTGVVGRTLAGGLVARGHEVVIGTRDVAATLGRSEPDRLGTPPYAQWQEAHPTVKLVGYAEAGEHGELVVNATAGAASPAALAAVGEERMAGKVLVDVANPLDFSRGMPPTLSVANTDSLAEQIQRAFPGTRVVKALNTMTASLMVEPARVPGRHNVFIAGDDHDAKATVEELLRDLGWPQEAIIDVGGIRAARGLEMYVTLWLTLYVLFGSPDFNIQIVRA